MTNTFDGHELHARLRALTDARDWPAAIAVVRALPDVSAEDLNGYPNGDLWWHFAEPLAPRSKLRVLLQLAFEPRAVVSA